MSGDDGLELSGLSKSIQKANCCRYVLTIPFCICHPSFSFPIGVSGKQSSEETICDLNDLLGHLFRPCLPKKIVLN